MDNVRPEGDKIYEYLQRLRGYAYEYSFIPCKRI